MSDSSLARSAGEVARRAEGVMGGPTAAHDPSALAKREGASPRFA